MSGPTDKAIAAWGEPLPDWIAALAAACESTNQSAVARVLGRSATIVSQVLSASYPAGMGAIEDIVRGKLMDGRVPCPEFGELQSQDCFKWRSKAEKFVSTNPQRVRMFKACRKCPFNAAKNGGQADAKHNT